MRHAGLCHRGDDGPGIDRLRRGSAFVYRGPRGRPIRDRATLQQIRSLAIRPAWTDVWIAPRAHQHLQATGRDARGRKQYLYHPDWRAQRESAKYDALLSFTDHLPRLRRRVKKDLRRRGLPREKVLACVVQLLDAAHLRIGNDEYARDNQSFGLTTLLDRHASIRGDAVRLRFRGKSGVKHDLQIRSKRIARIVARCHALRGGQLFQYVDGEGRVRDVTSADVNEYIQASTGATTTAKDFRTWAGAVLAVGCLRTGANAVKLGDARRQVRAMYAQVAAQLGNTVAVCRKSYVHPGIVDAYLSQAPGWKSTSGASSARASARRRVRRRASALDPDELALYSLLRRLAGSKNPARSR